MFVLDKQFNVRFISGNGIPIECCNSENYKLAPRYHHPACAPLLSSESHNKYGRQTCLNYVRSALAVGNNCNFGAVEQVILYFLE